MSRQLIALNRFGLGARPGEAQRLTDPQGWLLDQIAGEAPKLARTPPTEAEVGALQGRYTAAVRSQDREQIQAMAREIGRSNSDEVSNLLTTRVITARPFAERWIAFWSNHLCISALDGFRVSVIAGSYERAVARTHAFGRFDEMLLASARHPAMLFYLDNAASVGPGSQAAQRPRRGAAGQQNARRGLNENYARELLELHTVGVDGGYTQEDVEQLARVLTGWSVSGQSRQEAGTGASFRFAPQIHEPGRKTVLGERYVEGEEAGIQVLQDLARRPETARFISTKLVTHFIDDVPPQSAIDALAKRWMETEGDLREMARTLVTLDASWDTANRKFRTPQDWLVAMLRAVESREVTPNFGQILRQLRHQVWAPASPRGFGDLKREWADSDSLMNRAELARTAAERAGNAGARQRGASVGARRRPRGQDRGSTTQSSGDARPLATVVQLDPGDPLPQLLADESIPFTERVALGFAGPAFQWR